MSNIYGLKCLSQSKVFPVGRAPVFSELCDVCPNKLASWKIIHVVAVVLSDREKATQSPWAEFMMSLGSVNMTCAGELFSWTLSLTNPSALYLCFPGIHLIHRHASCNFRQGQILRLENRYFLCFRSKETEVNLLNWCQKVLITWDPRTSLSIS